MNKPLVIIILIVIIAGLITANTLNFKSVKNNSSVVLNPPQDVNPSPTRVIITVTKTPQPTFPPLSRVVKEVSTDAIIVTGDRGDMSLPKDAVKIKVYQRVQNQLVIKTFADIKVGQNVTVNILKPGELAEIIIENQL